MNMNCSRVTTVLSINKSINLNLSTFLSLAYYVKVDTKDKQIFNFMLRLQFVMNGSLTGKTSKNKKTKMKQLY